MNCNRKWKCADCGDRLIHQLNRGQDESSSALGQYIHDNIPNDFWFSDVDFMVYKKMTRIFRFVEDKRCGGAASNAQIFFLPFLAICIKLAIIFGLLHPQSGVFILFSDPPFNSATIQQVVPSLSWVLEKERKLDEKNLRAFLTAMPLSENDKEIKCEEIF